MLLAALAGGLPGAVRGRSRRRRQRRGGHRPHAEAAGEIQNLLRPFREALLLGGPRQEADPERPYLHAQTRQVPRRGGKGRRRRRRALDLGLHRAEQPGDRQRFRRRVADSVGDPRRLRRQLHARFRFRRPSCPGAHATPSCCSRLARGPPGKGGASGGWRSGWTGGAGSCCRSSSWRRTATCEPTSWPITRSTRSSTTICFLFEAPPGVDVIDRRTPGAQAP